MVTADAQCVIPTDDLQADIPFFTKTLKMRMDTIYPADDHRHLFNVLLPSDCCGCLE